MDLKAFGFPISWHPSLEGSLLVYGEVWSEDRKFLGNWTSSNLSFLETDLAKHAKEYEYFFTQTRPQGLGFSIDEENK